MNLFLYIENDWIELYLPNTKLQSYNLSPIISCFDSLVLVLSVTLAIILINCLHETVKLRLVFIAERNLANRVWSVIETLPLAGKHVSRIIS